MNGNTHRTSAFTFRQCQSCGQTGRFGIIPGADGTLWHAFYDDAGEWVVCGQVTQHRALAGRNRVPVGRRTFVPPDDFYSDPRPCRDREVEDMLSDALKGEQ